MTCKNAKVVCQIEITLLKKKNKTKHFAYNNNIKHKIWLDLRTFFFFYPFKVELEIWIVNKVICYIDNFTLKYYKLYKFSRFLYIKKKKMISIMFSLQWLL